MVDFPILIVNGVVDMREKLAARLRDRGFQVVRSGSPVPAWRLYLSQQPWLVLLDLPDEPEVEMDLLRKLKDDDSATIFVTSTTSDAKIATAAMKAGAEEVFILPSDIDELVGALVHVAREGVDSAEGKAVEDVSSVSSHREEKRREEKERLERFLREYGGNISKVARRLGCVRGTVYNKMRAYGIPLRDDGFGPGAECGFDPAGDRISEAPGAVATQLDTESEHTAERHELEVLIVEDLEHKRHEIALALDDEAIGVTCMMDGRAGWDYFKHHDLDCVITDLKMPKMDGIELIERIRQSGSRVPIVMVSGFANVPATVAAMKRGANHVYRYEDLKVPEFRDLIRSLADRFKEIRVA